MDDSSAWDETVSEFRALGGTIENICRKEGPHDIGLHLEDPGKPWALSVPQNLLVPVGDIRFVGGALKIRPSAMGDRERRFNESYQARFSWGAQGKRDVENYFATMRSLPGAARDLLLRDHGVNPRLFKVPDERELKQRFIRTRMFRYRGGSVLMPILDLVNYGEGASFRAGEGVSLKGMATGEVLVSYSRTDAFHVFLNWGFAAAAPAAYSWPLVCRAKSCTIRIRTNTTDGKRMGNAFVPEFGAKDGAFVFSHLMLANRKVPNLPRAIFSKLMREAGVEAPAPLFNAILRFNLDKFRDLLATVENAEGQGAEVLRGVARHQLAALSSDPPSQKLREAPRSESR